MSSFWETIMEKLWKFKKTFMCSLSHIRFEGTWSGEWKCLDSTWMWMWICISKSSYIWNVKNSIFSIQQTITIFQCFFWNDFTIFIVSIFFSTLIPYNIQLIYIHHVRLKNEKQTLEKKNFIILLDMMVEEKGSRITHIYCIFPYFQQKNSEIFTKNFSDLKIVTHFECLRIYFLESNLCEEYVTIEEKRSKHVLCPKCEIKGLD
jgi:hypothetical protein